MVTILLSSAPWSMSPRQSPRRLSCVGRGLRPAATLIADELVRRPSSDGTGPGRSSKGLGSTRSAVRQLPGTTRDPPDAAVRLRGRRPGPFRRHRSSRRRPPARGRRRRRPASRRRNSRGRPARPCAIRGGSFTDLGLTNPGWWAGVRPPESPPWKATTGPVVSGRTAEVEGCGSRMRMRATVNATENFTPSVGHRLQP